MRIGLVYNFTTNGYNVHTIYYIKLQVPFVSLSVCTPPPFSTRPSDLNQIWHTYSGRYGTHSQLKKIHPLHPRGNNFNQVICDIIESRAFQTFKNYRSTFDDVILRNVGSLVGNVIPLNLTDRLHVHYH